MNVISTIAKVLKAGLLWVYLRLVLSTSKVTLEGLKEIEVLRRHQNIVFAILHKDALLVPFLFSGENILTMVSDLLSQDYYATTLRWFGYKVTRGSTVTRGAVALLDFARHMKRNRCAGVSLAVDGPYGPKGKVKKGVVWIAKRFASPLVAIVAHAKPSLTLNTWDDTVIPLPFSLIRVALSRPIYPDSYNQDSEICNIQSEIELIFEQLQNHLSE